jgi:hypothetical protein
MRAVVAVAPVPTVPARPARPAWTLLHPGVAATETAPSGLTNRELREAPLFLVPLDARELCANQRPMHRSLFDFNLTRLDRSRVGDWLRNGLSRGFVTRVPRWRGDGGRHRLQMRGEMPLGRLDGFIGGRGWRGIGEVTGSELGGNVRFRHPGEHFLVKRRRRFLLASPRDLTTLVDVFRIARRASRLLDVFFYHRDDGMIGQPPLTRTVVIQYVAESQPALLH